MSPNLHGAAWIVLGTLLFSANDALVKFLGRSMSPFEIVWVRYVLGLVFLSPVFFHVGWRGLLAGIVAAGARALGGRRLAASVGPGIGPCCYEVGPELVPEFGPGGEAFFAPGKGDRLCLDVRAANARQLREGGVPEGQIHSVSDCTFHDADRYHSYRREGVGGGRMISYIGFAK